MTQCDTWSQGTNQVFSQLVRTRLLSGHFRNLLCERSLALQWHQIEAIQEFRCRTEIPSIYIDDFNSGPTNETAIIKKNMENTIYAIKSNKSGAQKKKTTRKHFIILSKSFHCHGMRK